MLDAGFEVWGRQATMSIICIPVLQSATQLPPFAEFSGSYLSGFPLQEGWPPASVELDETRDFEVEDRGDNEKEWVLCDQRVERHAKENHLGCCGNSP